MSDNKDTKSLNIDTTELRDNAGKRACDSGNKSQNSGVVCLNEGSGIGIEFFTLNENEKKIHLRFKIHSLTQKRKGHYLCKVAR